METKPGVYTTEFWTMVLGNIFSLLNVTGLWNYVPNKYSELFMAIISAIYMLARGQAKSGTPVDPQLKSTYKIAPSQKDAHVRG